MDDKKCSLPVHARVRREGIECNEGFEVPEIEETQTAEKYELGALRYITGKCAYVFVDQSDGLGKTGS